MTQAEKRQFLKKFLSWLEGQRNFLCRYANWDHIPEPTLFPMPPPEIEEVTEAFLRTDP